MAKSVVWKITHRSKDDTPMGDWQEQTIHGVAESLSDAMVVFTRTNPKFRLNIDSLQIEPFETLVEGEF